MAKVWHVIAGDTMDVLATSPSYRGALVKLLTINGGRYELRAASDGGWEMWISPAEGQSFRFFESSDFDEKELAEAVLLQAAADRTWADGREIVTEALLDECLREVIDEGSDRSRR